MGHAGEGPLHLTLVLAFTEDREMEARVSERAPLPSLNSARNQRLPK